ncbi:MAG: Ppx/GppA family phosphatase [Alphaproteobacteria bacterium]|jgi:exopolyphosphatase/guanosine-5'-triphosphate,3'-diphosphate pyrophosphatase|nr:Ppx/GppA family phosphatase [Alphaproteobacteria bacterium]
MTGPLLAALDLGTNNCRLLLARSLSQGRFQVIDSFSRITRLGEGLSSTGHLCEEAQARTIEALALCSDLMIKRGVEKSRLVATAACRQAANGQRFVKRVLDETGLDLEVISSEEEVMLAMLGCRPLLDPKARFALVFDIGGGSTEIAWIDRQKHENHGIIASESLPLGVVTLSERDSAARAQSLSAMRSRLQAFELRHAMLAYLLSGEACMLGTSGTVTTMGAIHLDLGRYERRRVDGLLLTRSDLAEVTARLAAMSERDRAAHPCIGPERADLVPAGMAIFSVLDDLWPAPKLGIADRGLREGLLSLMAAEASA